MVGEDKHNAVLVMQWLEKVYFEVAAMVYAATAGKSVEAEVMVAGD